MRAGAGGRDCAACSPPPYFQRHCAAEMEAGVAAAAVLAAAAAPGLHLMGAHGARLHTCQWGRVRGRMQPCIGGSRLRLQRQSLAAFFRLARAGAWGTGGGEHCGFLVTAQAGRIVETGFYRGSSGSVSGRPLAARWWKHVGKGWVGGPLARNCVCWRLSTSSLHFATCNLQTRRSGDASGSGGCGGGGGGVQGCTERGSGCGSVVSGSGGTLYSAEGNASGRSCARRRRLCRQWCRGEARRDGRDGQSGLSASAVVPSQCQSTGCFCCCFSPLLSFARPMTSHTSSDHTRAGIALAHSLCLGQ